MTQYQRLRISGGTYFFTVNLLDRCSDLLVREAGALRQAVARTRLIRPFAVDAWVVLPDHMHCVWTLPDGNADFGVRWMLIKRWFSAVIPDEERRSASRTSKGERAIWQRRFWEHAIRDARDYATHVDYVHFNPVKHGFVDRADKWRLSTFRRAVAQGAYPADWAGGETNGAFGERRE